MPEVDLRLHLTAAEQGLVRQLLSAHGVDPAATRVFGSRVAGWPGARGVKPHSDLDLALSGRPAALTLAALRADLDESDLRWRVDLCSLDELPAGLRELVLQYGVPLTP